MRNGSRSAAQSFMIDVAIRQQQHLIGARSYAGETGALATVNRQGARTCSGKAGW